MKRDGSPLSPAQGEAEKKGRPPRGQADDGKRGGEQQGGQPGQRNDAGDERVAPGNKPRG